MKLKLNRVVAFAAASLLGLGGLVAGASAANAATGSLILPATGTGASTFNIKTSAACSAGATNFRATIAAPAVTGGSAAWNNLVLVTNTAITTFGDLVASGAPIGNSFDAIAATAGVKFDPNTYTITGFCQNALGTTTFDTFTATIVVTGTIGAAGNTFTYQAPAAPASTTVLTVSPASPVLLGTNVTLTATVTSTATVAGTINFFDGATQLAGAVPVGGVATFSSTTYAGGSHSFTAVFVPSNPTTIAGSTSAAVPFTVTAPAASTTTTLTFSPAAPTTATPLVLTATVAPATAVGTVAFLEGTTQVGSGTVTGGVATATLTGVTAATHTYTATFTPANPANFLTSTSAAVPVVVAAFTGYNLNGVAGSGEPITVTIPAGTLTLTAATTSVDLGTVNYDATKNLYVSAAKDINPVTVADFRSGSLGYTVSGIAGDFTSGANQINSENLGWTPKIVTPGTGVNASAGQAVAGAGGIAPGVVSNPVQGLKASRTLGSAVAGASFGTVVFGATLSLSAPTSTPAGTYGTTLVITAI